MAGEREIVKKKDIPAENKTKKTREEVIKTALAAYLKNRNYRSSAVSLGKPKKTNVPLSQTSRQFLFDTMIKEDVAKVNTFLYSNVLCLTNHYNAVKQYFARFVKFIQSLKQPIKDELSDLFGPIICHIYIDLLKGREWEPACDFLRNHAHLVAPVENLNGPLPSKINGCSVGSTNLNDDTNSSLPTVTTQILFVNESTGRPVRDYFKGIISTLSTCLRMETLNSIESIVLFRSSKYNIELSLASINTLKDFLEKQGHVIVLNILHKWIHFTVKDLKDRNEQNVACFLNRHKLIKEQLEQKHAMRKRANITAIMKSIKEKKRVSSNTYLKRLTTVLTKLENMPTPIKIIKISDPDKSLINATIDPGECHAVATFQNSSIKLWQLNRNTNIGRNMYEKIHIRHCEWAITNESKLEDDTDDILDEESSVSRKRELFYEKKYEDNSFDESAGIILRGHSRGVTECIFSKRFPLLFSTSKDSTMRAWKSDYSCGAVYKGHNYPIWCVSESPIGTYLATGSKDTTARLWTIEREFPLLTYVGHNLDIDCIAFHPNGNYLATGSSDLSIRLWSVTNGKLIRVLTECRYPASLAFSPNGKYLAAADEGNKVRIFDLAAGSQINEFDNNTSSVSYVAWNSNGNKIASCCSDGSVCIWDLTKAETINQQTLTPFTTKAILNYNSVCNRAIKMFFNSQDMITLIGSTSIVANTTVNTG